MGRDGRLQLVRRSLEELNIKFIPFIVWENSIAVL